VAVDGLTPAEAAIALGISRVAARVRLHRSRGRLRELLARPGSSTDPKALISRTPAAVPGRPTVCPADSAKETTR
jgi:hypothetical protein